MIERKVFDSNLNYMISINKVIKVENANARFRSTIYSPHYSKPQSLPSKTGTSAFYVSKSLPRGLFFQQNFAELISKRTPTYFYCS